MNLRTFYLLLLTIINTSNTLNILAIYPYNGLSHFLVFRVLLKELASKGHNVTVISHFPEKHPLERYHDISLAESSTQVGFEILPTENRYLNVVLTAVFLASSGTENCEVMLENKQVRDLISAKQKFDVILLEQFNSDCALGVAYKIGGPIVATTSHVLMPYHFDRFGIPDNPSFVSHHFLEGGTKPSFLQRLERVFFNFYFKTTYRWMTQRTDQKTLAKYFDDIPPLEELAKDIKFLLLYHNFALTGSKLLPANVIEVGGFHVTQSQPLSGNLKKFIDEAPHGVVYISFGSVLKASDLQKHKLEAILGAMKEFPQRFVWKWEDESLQVDSNKLYFEKWLPQLDILGHPKTLAFFSHAGMGGTTEAIHFGVPIIAMPMFGDQPSNAAAIEESGYGIQLHYRDLTKENLVAALKKVLEPEFRAKAKEVSSAWHDRPQSPLDTAVFWIEFAARHPSLSFRSPAADVPFYQYFLQDVLGVLLAIILLAFWIISLCCKNSKSIKTTDRKSYQKKKKA